MVRLLSKSANIIYESFSVFCPFYARRKKKSWNSTVYCSKECFVHFLTGFRFVLGTTKRVANYFLFELWRVHEIMTTSLAFLQTPNYVTKL